MSHVPSVKSLHMAPLLLQEQCPGCPGTHSLCDTVLLGAGLATVLGGLAGLVPMSSAQLPPAVDTTKAGTGERKLKAFDIKQPGHAEQGQAQQHRVPGADQWCPGSVSQTQSYCPLTNKHGLCCPFKGGTTASPWHVPGTPLCHLAWLKGSTGFAGWERPRTNKTHPCPCICAQRVHYLSYKSKFKALRNIANDKHKKNQEL